MNKYRIMVTTTAGKLVVLWVEAMNWYEAAMKIWWLTNGGVSAISIGDLNK